MVRQVYNPEIFFFFRVNELSKSSLGTAVKKRIVRLKRKGFWFPILFVLPPIALQTMRLDWKILAVTETKKFLTAHEWFAFLLLLWPAIYVFISQLIKKLETETKEYEKPNQLGATNLLLAINGIVGDKIVRVSNYFFQKNSPNNLKPNVSLAKFINDDVHIYEILRKLYEFFGTTYGNSVTIRICLACMGEKHIGHYHVYLPGDLGPSTSIEDLQHDDSLFSRVKKKRRTIIVENIGKEGKKLEASRNYRPNPDGEEKDAAIIGVPIVHTELNEVPYVLTIEASEPKFFQEKMVEKWKFILEPFAKRIALEHFTRTIINKTPGGG